MSAQVEVLEFTDPGCQWCWGSEPKLRYLRGRYGPHVQWRRVFGVQLDGKPGADSGEAPELVRERWLQMAAHSAAPITPVLTRAHASTRPAAAAAKASELQGEAVAARAIRRLREAFFIVGEPADSSATIEHALHGTPGLDLNRLLSELDSEAVRDALDADWREARDPHESVIGLRGEGPHPGGAKDEGASIRYVFPTIVVRGPAGERIVPGWRELDEYIDAFEAVEPELTAVSARPLSADAALVRYRSLSSTDIELLTADDEPPARGLRTTTATTPLWLHPDDVRSRSSSPAAGARQLTTIS